MHVSIVICTRNRARMLRRALWSLAECKKPDGDGSWEVLVVDNASDDDTPSVVDEFRARLPIRYVHEPELGLSKARNRSVKEARGTWILWIDDDVTVCTEWLQGYIEAIQRFPDAVALGGPIIVDLGDDPPAWLIQGLGWVEDAYAGRSPNELRGRFYSAGPKPYGANFGLRYTAARSVPFDTRLGHHPSRPTMGGEETEVIRAVLLHGTGWWVPEAFVTHHIDAARQTARYLKAYFTSAGSMSARSWSMLPMWNRLRELAIAIRRACVNQIRYLLLCIVQDKTYRARALRYAAWNRGYIKGCLGATFTRTKKGLQ
jgi:glucosyl-dolichyl phosphate glucuronosyltransferase